MVSTSSQVYHWSILRLQACAPRPGGGVLRFHGEKPQVAFGVIKPRRLEEPLHPERHGLAAVSIQAVHSARFFDRPDLLRVGDKNNVNEEGNLALYPSERFGVVCHREPAPALRRPHICEVARAYYNLRPIAAPLIGSPSGTQSICDSSTRQGGRRGGSRPVPEVQDSPYAPVAMCNGGCKPHGCPQRRKETQGKPARRVAGPRCRENRAPGWCFPRNNR